MGQNTINVSEAAFESEVMQRSTSVPVIVDLWAPWCGPCQSLGPILERTVDAYGGKIILAKVNVDENPSIAQAFEVQSIPAVYVVAGGQVVDGFIGAIAEHELQGFVHNVSENFADPEILAELAHQSQTTSSNLEGEEMLEVSEMANGLFFQQEEEYDDDSGGFDF